MTDIKELALSKGEIERFHSSYSKREDGCWVWGKASSKGYGVFYFEHQGKMKAHRLSYLIHRGVFDESLFVCHKCDNPPCVNPDHLFLGTHSDNMRDMNEKGRNGAHRKPECVMRGSGHPQAKLTEDVVRAIRKDYKEYAYHRTNSAELADKYGVTAFSINKIVANKTWRHI